MSEKNIPPKENGPGVPRQFLTPYLLIMVKCWRAHGYQILRNMSYFGLPSIDQGTIYRHLRQLEKNGFLSSFWDTGTRGPARRVYDLTDAGEEFLQTWASTIEQYRLFIDQFFKFFTAPEENSMEEGDDSGR